MAKRKVGVRRAGWREWVVLPELCPTPIKAKLDTGAQTSALHAFGLSVSDDDPPLATFEIHPHQRSADDAVPVSVPVDGFRRVRSSSGHAEVRPLVHTPVRIGTRTYEVDVTLTRRDEMGFRMLLGRSALRRRFVVDSGRSYLTGTER